MRDEGGANEKRTDSDYEKIEEPQRRNNNKLRVITAYEKDYTNEKGEVIMIEHLKKDRCLVDTISK